MEQRENMTKWMDKEVLDFINVYKYKSFLWNKHHKDYYCRERRSEAIAELAAMFEIRPIQVQKKIETLSRTYKRHLYEVMRSTAKHGQAAEAPTWFAYKALDSFLRRKYTEIITAKYGALVTSGVTTENDNDATADNDNDVAADSDNDAATDNDEVQVVNNDEVEQIYKIEDSSEDEIDPKEEELLITSTDITKQEMNTVENPLPEHPEMDDDEPYVKRPKLAEATSRSRSRTYADVRKKDDCDLFGKYVSETMRKFDRKTRCVVQYLVSNILCQADLGAFQDGSFDWQGLVGFQAFNAKSCNEDENK